MKRFWDKTIPIPECGCLLWTAGTDHKGYGRFQNKGKWCRAHRVSWELTNGVIPDNKMVLHQCDTPACVNPRHLFLGNNSDNMKDAWLKGRLFIPSTQGERNPMSKITDEQRKEIKSDNRLHREIAKDYGICESRVSQIKSRGREGRVKELIK
jgi:HNH endonuclease